ncbi:hypothetical protein J1605_019635 [Eschrichtius robustus]|uniref:Uncharacterized protein n=1 Tax=Eschrichtius robustus TaxID=9764 RepID=A0AB34HHX7_ESCRO|nr:hypothetical protein J1605_019635 [Eschrichtius robustus]
MDATTAPHRIPPEMPQYGEANHVFELMQNMLEQLLIHQPKDPIPFMIEHLQRDNDYEMEAAKLRPHPWRLVSDTVGRDDKALMLPPGFRWCHASVHL